MLRNFIFLFKILNSNQKINLFSLQLLIILSSLLETISILSIAPFIALISNNEIFFDKNIQTIFNYIGSANYSDFIIHFGLIIFLFFFLTTIMNIVTNYGLIKFSQNLSVFFTTNLYKYYLNKDLIFFNDKNSNDLISKIILETSRITGGTIQAIMILISKSSLVIFITIGLLIYNIKISLISFLMITFFYVLLNLFIHKKIILNGKNITDQNKIRIKSINEGFENIKEIIFYNKSNFFIRNFLASAKSLAKSQLYISTLSTLPLYFFQFVLIGSLILAILILTNYNNQSFDSIVTTLSVFALAGLRLIPSLNGIYTSFTQIKSNQPAFQNLKTDLKNIIIDNYNFEKPNKEKISVKKYIEINKLSFRYPNSNKFIFKNFNLKIELGKIIGIKGKTGIGKTTLIDLLLGLIKPLKGNIIIDGNILKFKSQTIGQLSYVPQNIYLFDTTIKENVSFISNDVETSKKNIAQLKKVLKISNSDIFVNKLRGKYNFKVGERGIKLSGGQIQRLGIARALYNEPKVIIFDESTNSLDAKTEKLILKNLRQYVKMNNGTILFIAHNKTVLNYCDEVINLDDK